MSNLAHTLLSIAGFAVWALIIVMIVQIIFSWLVAFNVINTYNNGVRQFLYWLDRITEPFYRPVRSFMPDFGGLDFSPMVVLIVLNLLLQLIYDLQYRALL
ncbi:YggT family protein [Parasphingopyxis marina]|uniref:YggT family protein n=1 Tax=Parasphingopyxis marina TaxID=2761622 RepID=A0A842HUU7_9SPHN|nr:YggT family protein [Parasphingopyxis marina]MBC2776161.1 YggT family protein [Parasphingopyxis marina]